MNELFKKIESKETPEYNMLVTNSDKKTKGGKNSQGWKMILKGYVKEFHKDLGKLNALLQGIKMKRKYRDSLQKRYTKWRRKG